MPRIIDKIIINNEQSAGDWAAIQHQYTILNRLGQEIKEQGRLDETDHFTAQMQAACDAKAKADRVYLDALRELTRDMAAFINGPKKP